MSASALRPPPRPLPWGLFCAAAMDWSGAFWAAFLSVWVLHLTILSADGKPGEVLRLRLSGRTTVGVVTALQPSGTILNGHPLAHVAYRYKDADGSERQALAYDHASAWSVGEAGTVIHLPGQAVSRLRGPGQEPYGLFGWVQWILPLSALVLGSTAWRRGIEAFLLLKAGTAAEAAILGSWRPRLRSRLRVEYRYEDDEGRQRRGWSDLPLDAAPAGPKAAILFVPGNSYISVLFDAVPWRFPAGLDSKGNWRYTGGRLPKVRFTSAAMLLTAAGVCGLAHLAGLLPDIGR